MQFKTILESTCIYSANQITPLFHEGSVLLADVDGELYLVEDKTHYRISSHPYEPCTYIHQADGKLIIIHNAIDISDIYRAAQTNETIGMITGNEYSTREICRLLLCATKLSLYEMDISYLERCKFIVMLTTLGAVSPAVAVDLSAYGLKNHNIMKPLFCDNWVCRTADGKYYVLKPRELETIYDLLSYSF